VRIFSENLSIGAGLSGSVTISLLRLTYQLRFGIRLLAQETVQTAIRNRF